MAGATDQVVAELSVWSAKATCFRNNQWITNMNDELCSVRPWALQRQISGSF